jgi:hypothetical protein
MRSLAIEGASKSKIACTNGFGSRSTSWAHTAASCDAALSWSSRRVTGDKDPADTEYCRFSPELVVRALASSSSVSARYHTQLYRSRPASIPCRLNRQPGNRASAFAAHYRRQIGLEASLRFLMA